MIETAAISSITPDEEYCIYAEDKLISLLSKHGIDYAPLMTRVYEMMYNGIKYTEKVGTDFAYDIASRELLNIFSDYKEERKEICGH